MADTRSSNDPGDKPPSKLHALHREAWFAEGRSDALGFAVECEGDVTQLKAKVQEIVDQLAYRLAMEPKGAASPGASPRIYKDGYLAGLRDAINIMESAQADE